MFGFGKSENLKSFEKIVKSLKDMSDAEMEGIMFTKVVNSCFTYCWLGGLSD